jgi:hypothetical protein
MMKKEEEYLKSKITHKAKSRCRGKEFRSGRGGRRAPDGDRVIDDGQNGGD